MVTPIDAVRCGMGYDEAGHWHKANLRRVQVWDDEREDPLAPMTGLLWGALASGALWAVLILAVKALLRLF